jgi:hypothetical protein
MIRQCGTTGDNAVFGLFERNLQPTPLVFQPKPISSQFGYDPRLAEMFAARYEGGGVLGRAYRESCRPCGAWLWRRRGLGDRQSSAIRIAMFIHR